MPALVTADYRRALDFLRVAHEVDSGDPLPPQVLDELRRLIPASIATYRELDDTSGMATISLSGADAADTKHVWALYPHVREHDPIPGLYSRAALPISAGKALRFSDVVSLAQLRAGEFYADMCRPLGTKHVMKLFLRVGGRTGGLVLESEARDFTTRDRDLLDLLAPHLTLLRKRPSVGPTQWRSEAVERLSAREREVLALVAAGMTNGEIAASLFVATGTVRKHLDNAYRKLGVRGRAEAVAVTRPASPDTIAACGDSPSS